MPSLPLDVSVVIPSYNDRGHLRKLLVALDEQHLPVREVIIAHSGEGDPTDQLPETALPVRVLHSDAQLFSGAARNVGAAKATGRWLAFLDDDVIPATDWSEAVAGLLRHNPQDDCMVGSIEFSESGGYWGLSIWFLEFGSVHRYMPSRPIEGGASANMLISRSLFQRAGGFPHQVKRSVDVEFMARCRARGGQTRFINTLTVAHHNNPGMSHCRDHAYRLGWGSARVRTLSQLRGEFFVRYPALSHLLIPIRLLQMSYRLARWGTGRRWLFIQCLPGITYALFAWVAGFRACIKETRESGGPVA